MAFNIVEHITDPNESAFDQPCKFGHRVEGHAVYCHNDSWTNGPRKCRRTWYTGGTVRDEDCPGFQRNEAFTGTLVVVPTFADPCVRCGGAKLVTADPIRKTVETCDECQGDGVAVPHIDLGEWEVYVLECCLGAKFSNPFDHETTILSGDLFRLREFPGRLLDDGLLQMRSVGWDGPAMIHVVRLTRKGYAILKQNWDRSRNGRSTHHS